MKAKLLTDAGEIKKGTVVNVDKGAGSNSERGTEDVGGESTKAGPVFGVSDDVGHTEEVDTRDLEVTL